MECASPILNNNSGAGFGTSEALVLFFFLLAHLISVRSEMYVSIVKTWRFFVMNYSIMVAEVVIKCVLFYDDGVIEEGCNKSCRGLSFFFFFFVYFSW